MESSKIYDGSCTKQAKHMMEIVQKQSIYIMKIAQKEYQAKQTV
jgi:hypothetical protein